MMISIQTEDFNLAQEYARLRDTAGDAGAIVTFTGLVREVYAAHVQEKVQTLTLEHYPGMTEKCLNAITAQANDRWQLLATRIVHRVGELRAGDQIVFVGAASAHREHAFAAAEFMMDYLKSEAPFWKKQTNSSNVSHWVDARSSDSDALTRWQQDKT